MKVFTFQMFLNRVYIPRQSVSARARLFIYCNELCAYCGNKVTYKRATIDHVVPLAKRGHDGTLNYILACKKCNNKKSDLTLLEFIGLI